VNLQDFENACGQDIDGIPDAIKSRLSAFLYWSALSYMEEIMHPFRERDLADFSQMKEEFTRVWSNRRVSPKGAQYIKDRLRDEWNDPSQWSETGAQLSEAEKEALIDGFLVAGIAKRNQLLRAYTQAIPPAPDLEKLNARLAWSVNAAKLLLENWTDAPQPSFADPFLEKSYRQIFLKTGCAERVPQEDVAFLEKIFKESDDDEYTEIMTYRSLEARMTGASAIDLSDFPHGLVECLAPNSNIKTLNCTGFQCERFHLNDDDPDRHKSVFQLLELRELTELFLDDSTVANLSGVERLGKLEVLSLRNTRIEKLPGSLAELRNLRRLDLRDCANLKFSAELLEILGKLESLEELGLPEFMMEDLNKPEYQSLRDKLPQQLLPPSPIASPDRQEAPTDSWSAQIQPLSREEFVRQLMDYGYAPGQAVSENRWKAVERMIWAFDHQEEDSLDLGQLGLTAVPPGLDQLSHIKEVDLSVNYLNDLDPALFRMTWLEDLDVASNFLKRLDPRIAHMTELSTLGLGNNLLTDLAPLSNLQNLRQLRAGYNRLTGDSFNGFEHLENLEELRVTHNNIQYFPPALCKLKQLESLLLSNNFLRKIPDDIPNLYCLSSLQLSGNPLDTLPEGLKKLPPMCDVELLEMPELSMAVLRNFRRSCARLAAETRAASDDAELNGHPPPSLYGPQIMIVSGGEPLDPSLTLQEAVDKWFKTDVNAKSERSAPPADDWMEELIDWNPPPDWTPYQDLSGAQIVIDLLDKLRESNHFQRRDPKLLEQAQETLKDVPKSDLQGLNAEGEPRPPGKDGNKNDRLIHYFIDRAHYAIETCADRALTGFLDWRSQCVRHDAIAEGKLIEALIELREAQHIVHIASVLGTERAEYESLSYDRRKKQRRLDPDDFPPDETEIILGDMITLGEIYGDPEGTPVGMTFESEARRLKQGDPYLEMSIQVIDALRANDLALAKKLFEPYLERKLALNPHANVPQWFTRAEFVSHWDALMKKLRNELPLLKALNKKRNEEKAAISTWEMSSAKRARDEYLWKFGNKRRWVARTKALSEPPKEELALLAQSLPRFAAWSKLKTAYAAFNAPEELKTIVAQFIDDAERGNTPVPFNRDRLAKKFQEWSPFQMQRFELQREMNWDTDAQAALDTLIRVAFPTIKRNIGIERTETWPQPEKRKADESPKPSRGNQKFLRTQSLPPGAPTARAHPIIGGPEPPSPRPGKAGSSAPTSAPTWDAAEAEAEIQAAIKEWVRDRDITVIGPPDTNDKNKEIEIVPFFRAYGVTLFLVKPSPEEIAQNKVSIIRLTEAERKETGLSDARIQEIDEMIEHNCDNLALEKNRLIRLSVLEKRSRQSVRESPLPHRRHPSKGR